MDEAQPIDIPGKFVAAKWLGPPPNLNATIGPWKTWPRSGFGD